MRPVPAGQVRARALLQRITPTDSTPRERQSERVWSACECERVCAQPRARARLCVRVCACVLVRACRACVRMCACVGSHACARACARAYLCASVLVCVRSLATEPSQSLSDDTGSTAVRCAPRGPPGLLSVLSVERAACSVLSVERAACIVLSVLSVR